MNKIEFDIITINFNGSQYIRETLSSVIDQNYPNYQHIIQDGDSNDSSIEIIKNMSEENDKISLISEQDSGPSNALNRALARSQAEYLLFLNSDDLLLAGSLHQLNKIFQTQDKFDILFAAGLIIDANGEKIKSYFPTKFSRFKYAYGVSVPFHPATIFRRDFIERAQISFNESNKSCWDGEFIVDCSYFFPKIGYSNSLIAAFRLHENSISSNLSHSNYKKDQDLIFKKIMGRAFYKIDHLIGFVLRLVFLSHRKLQEKLRIKI